MRVNFFFKIAAVASKEEEMRLSEQNRKHMAFCTATKPPFQVAICYTLIFFVIFFLNKMKFIKTIISSSGLLVILKKRKKNLLLLVLRGLY